MNNGRIRLVCFDVGGVLVKHCRTWAEGCRAAGLPLHPIAESPEMVTRRRELSRLLTTGKIGIGEFCRRVGHLLEDAYSPRDVERVHHAWLGTEYDGVYAVVQRLVRTGVPTAALSNTNGAHWARFDSPASDTALEFPTVGLLRHRHASHLLGFAKPDPGAYGAFERAIGFEGDPGSILFLDDLSENVAAAGARGWTAERIDHTSETAGQIEAVLVRHGLL